MIILIKSVVNKNKHEYYYNIFLEKSWYKDKPDTLYFLMNICILYMLYFHRIDISEGTDVGKAVKQVHQQSVTCVTFGIS